MSKYGWEKGQSLGSSQTGLITPLIARPDRQKKGTGTILNRNKRREDYGEQGKMSRCVVLGNVVDPGEVDEELVDEIGGECREKYGEVERMRVVEGEGDVVKVFVLFTSELSALRGVNGLNGRLFGGRTIKAAFYDEDKFEAGDFK
jgi:splicing factor 45